MKNGAIYMSHRECAKPKKHVEIEYNQVIFTNHSLSKAQITDNKNSNDLTINTDK